MRSNQYKRKVPETSSLSATSHTNTGHLIARASHIHSQGRRKNKKPPSSKSRERTKNNVRTLVQLHTRGKLYLLLILSANSWPDPPNSTHSLQTPQKETTPFESCQSLWLTSCCNKHGKDSVSLADYFSYVLQKKYTRTLPLLPTSQSQEEEFSRPVNKTSAKPSLWESERDPPSWQVSVRAASTWGD